MLKSIIVSGLTGFVNVKYTNSLEVYMNKDEIYKTIGRRIREERQRIGLTQEELADKAEIHPSFLGQIERGTKKASIVTVELIARALNMESGALFNERKWQPKKSRRSEWQTKIIGVLESLQVKEQQFVYETIKGLSKRIRKLK